MAPGGVRILNFRTWAGYPVGAALVAMATWLKLLAQPNIIAPEAPITYFIAVVPTSIFFGLGPSVFVCITSLIAFDYYFLPPIYTISLLNPDHAATELIFLVVGIMFSYLTANLRTKQLEAINELSARREIELELTNLKDHLEDLVVQRTIELKKINSLLAKEIQHRAMVEQKLRNSEQRLLLAQHAGRTGTWEWDTRTNAYIWSDEVWELFGLDSQVCEPSFESWKQSVHPDDRQIVEQQVLNAAQTFSKIDVEWRLASNKERWLMSVGQPVADNGGKFTKYLGVVIDITERKKTSV